jgi:hypothetical protein
MLSRSQHRVASIPPPGGSPWPEFGVPTFGSKPDEIAVGPDGNLSFTEFTGNKVGRINLLGHITEFSVPTPGGQPQGITAGPDGALWFGELSGLASRDQDVSWRRWPCDRRQ